MTDVTVAPDGGSAPPAAPTEVPVNENQVSSPSPIGAQTPDKPVTDFEGSPHRPESRRESIQKAFERALNPPPAADRRAPPKTDAKPAEAKPGHNNPPEETPKDKPAIDLRRRPSADEPREPQPRERGRFAPREPVNNEVRPEMANRGQPGEPGQQQARQQQPNPAYRDPPARMSEQAKRDWAAAPESIRGDFHRLAKEAGDMYRAYRPDHDVMNTIRPYHEMAVQQGTSLERALSNYWGMEQKLRSDVIAGLDLIIYNLNLRGQNGQRLTFRDIAYHVLSQSPEQLRATQLGNSQQAASHQIGALHQEIAGLKQTLQEMHNRQQFTYTRSAVDQFATGHPRFDELGDLIENELKLGFDLETAYRRADLLRPTTHAAQTRTTSAQTRTPDRSIYGVPSGASDVTASNAASRKPREISRTPRDAVERAIARVNGSM